MEYREISERLFEASIAAGVVAKAMQKDIYNEGKEVAAIHGEDQEHYEMRQAKTKVDVMVQDMLLLAVRKYAQKISLDVEEESCYPFLFAQEGKHTLIIDPIDGTLQYIRQKDTYSICSALIYEQEIMLAIVYFPAKNILYFYEASQGAKVYENVDQCSFQDGKELVINKRSMPDYGYKNDRVAAATLQLFQAFGLQIIDDKSCDCPSALIQCLQGEAACYLSDTRNIRDILMGAILSKTKQGAAYDLQGNALRWPAKGRVPFAIFTMFPKEIQKILK